MIEYLGIAKSKGFKMVSSSPFTRSSYHGESSDRNGAFVKRTWGLTWIFYLQTWGIKRQAFPGKQRDVDHFELTIMDLWVEIGQICNVPHR